MWTVSLLILGYFVGFGFTGQLVHHATKDPGLAFLCACIWPITLPVLMGCWLADHL